MKKKQEAVTLWIVTGLSGAGKSQAINCFEDFGFFCVDNLPIQLLPKLGDLCQKSGRSLKRVALGIDVREGDFLDDFLDVREQLEDLGIQSRILYLEADDATLIRRFSETRRRHPLGNNVREGIALERKKLLRIKEAAHVLINTSRFTQGDLKERLSSLLRVEPSQELHVSIVSFGYKHGLPTDADVVWDVRFLPNPNYISGLRRKTGKDVAVKRFVFKSPQVQSFVKKFFGLLAETLPAYQREGKSYLTIAIGCTGGHHRSVAISEALQKFLTDKKYTVRLQHRDIHHD